MTNNNINSIVKKLEDLLRSEFAKCETVDGNFSSGEENYHLYKITAPEEYGALIIARDWFNSLYMAQFECADGKIDIFFGFNTKQRNTIRWRYYFEDGKYTQGELDDWFLSEQASKTMITLIGGTGVGEDGHEGHYFNTIHRTPNSIYSMTKENAVEEIVNAYENAVSSDIVKAAIMKQTMLKGDYDSVRFWSGFDMPEPEEDDDDRKSYDNCEIFVNSLDMKTLVEMFDDIDSRFNSWCTPSYSMLVEFANLSKEESK